MDEPKSKIKRAHTVCLGTKITITGVQNVLTMTDRLVEVGLVDNVLVLTGTGFVAQHLDVDAGELVLMGSVSTLKYQHQVGRESLWRRLIK